MVHPFTQWLQVLFDILVQLEFRLDRLQPMSFEDIYHNKDRLLAFNNVVSRVIKVSGSCRLCVHAH